MGHGGVDDLRGGDLGLGRPAACGREAADKERVGPRHLRRPATVVDHQVEAAGGGQVGVGFALEEFGPLDADLGQLAGRLGPQGDFQGLVRRW